MDKVLAFINPPPPNTEAAEAVGEVLIEAALAKCAEAGLPVPKRHRELFAAGVLLGASLTLGWVDPEVLPGQGVTGSYQ